MKSGSFKKCFQNGVISVTRDLSHFDHFWDLGNHQFWTPLFHFLDITDFMYLGCWISTFRGRFSAMPGNAQAKTDLQHGHTAIFRYHGNTGFGPILLNSMTRGTEVLGRSLVLLASVSLC